MTSDLDLCRAFLDAHPRDAAQVLERLPAADVASLLESLPQDTSARTLAQMTPVAAADCLARIQPDAATAVVAALPPGHAALLLRRMDDALQATLLERLTRVEADLLHAVLRYPEHTAGALMDPKAVALGEDVTVADALGVLRHSPNRVLDDVYVIDRGQRLVGVVALRDLMLARPENEIGRIMTRAVSSLRARMGRAAILAHPGWRQFHTLPVVDEESRLVGVIGHETFRALEDETRGDARRADALATVVALGELYWLGLSGVVDGLASAVKRTPSKTAASAEAGDGLA